MSDVKEILVRARRLGLTLQLEGDRIAVAPARLCPPDLLSALRAHKPVVIALLEGDSCGLPADQAAWLHTARQILAGEFDDCDRSTRESLAIGLRSVIHPRCRRALERLGIDCSKFILP